MFSRDRLLLLPVALILAMTWGAALNDAVAGEETDGTRRLANSGLFLPYDIHVVGSYAETAAIGDVNNDGRNDVVVGTTYGNDPENDDHIHVFLQNSSGELEAPVKYPVVPADLQDLPTSLDIGDLNNDGKQDVVVAGNDCVGVFLQNDSGTLDAMIPYYSGHVSSSNAFRVRVGDFNNDGLTDVVSIDWGTQSHDVDVFLQNLSGTLDPPLIYVVEHGGYDDLDVGDVNNDGLDDIIVMSGQYYGYDNLGILLQNPDGTLDPPVYYDLGADVNSNGVAVGDVNGDDRNDVVLTYTGNYGVFLQNESDTLNPSISYPSSGDTKPVEIGDVNGDGLEDVLSAGGPTLEVLLQSPTGILLPYERYTVPYETHYPRHAMAIGDINNDQMNDVVLASGYDGLAVLYSALQPPPLPDIKANGSDGPVHLSPADTVEITVSLDPGSMEGVRCDWWVVARTRYGNYWLAPSMNWVRSNNPISVRMRDLIDLPEISVLSRALPPGKYTFFFVLDDRPNGVLDDLTWRDSVVVMSSPTTTQAGAGAFPLGTE